MGESMDQLLAWYRCFYTVLACQQRWAKRKAIESQRSWHLRLSRLVDGRNCGFPDCAHHAAHTALPRPIAFSIHHPSLVAPKKAFIFCVSCRCVDGFGHSTESWQRSSPACGTGCNRPSTASPPTDAIIKSAFFSSGLAPPSCDRGPVTDSAAVRR